VPRVDDPAILHVEYAVGEAGVREDQICMVNE
jgi:hypothetical protein